VQGLRGGGLRELHARSPARDHARAHAEAVGTQAEGQHQAPRRQDHRDRTVTALADITAAVTTHLHDLLASAADDRADPQGCDLTVDGVKYDVLGGDDATRYDAPDDAVLLRRCETGEVFAAVPSVQIIRVVPAGTVTAAA
jgi:hypothetical protein